MVRQPAVGRNVVTVLRGVRFAFESCGKDLQWKSPRVIIMGGVRSLARDLIPLGASPLARRFEALFTFPQVQNAARQRLIRIAAADRGLEVVPPKFA